MDTQRRKKEKWFLYVEKIARKNIVYSLFFETSLLNLSDFIFNKDERFDGRL